MKFNQRSKTTITMAAVALFGAQSLAPDAVAASVQVAQMKPATSAPGKAQELKTVDIRKKDEAAPETPLATGVNPEAWRKNVPTMPPPRPFKLPNIVTYKLDNGMKVELVEDHRFPFVTFAMGIKAGSTLDPHERLGMSDLTADMLVEGTDKRSSKQIADDVDFIGGGLKAISEYDYTEVSASALSKYQDRMLELMSDVLLHPTFPQDELDLKKTNLIQELAMKRSEPDFLVQERFDKVLFGSHPYSVVAPTPASVKALTQADLRTFHDANYVPNESSLVVVGDFDPAKMKEMIAKDFDGWKPGTIKPPVNAEVPAQHGKRIYLVNRPGSVQSSIKLGNVSISKTDENYFPMLVANQVLGGAAQARLFLNIREQKGYTYGAYSNISARRERGPFQASADVRTDVTSPSLEEFIYELSRIRDVPVTAKELKDAKNYLVGSFQLNLETQSGLAQRLLETNVYNLPDNYLETYSDKVLAVSGDQVRTAARKLIDLDNIVIAVVGDAVKIKKDLEFFAPVEVYDTSGKLTTEWEKLPSPGS